MLQFNPITGILDEVADHIYPIDTSTPTNKQDGYVSIAEISSDGRLYWVVSGVTYHASGVLS